MVFVALVISIAILIIGTVAMTVIDHKVRSPIASLFLLLLATGFAYFLAEHKTSMLFFSLNIAMWGDRRRRVALYNPLNPDESRVKRFSPYELSIFERDSAEGFYLLGNLMLAASVIYVLGSWIWGIVRG